MNPHEYRVHSLDGFTRVVNSHEVIPTQYVEEINIPIERFRHNHNTSFTETLLAIHPDVKEQLALLKVPDMVVDIHTKYERKLNVAKANHKAQQDTTNKLLKDERDKVDTLLSATFWQRIKWLFKGVHICKTS